MRSWKLSNGKLCRSKASSMELGSVASNIPLEFRVQRDMR